MTAISWISTISGNWNTASNWSTDTVPGSGDDVSIIAIVDVAVASSVAVGSFTEIEGTTVLASGVTLSTGAASFGGSGGWGAVDGPGKLATTGATTITDMDSLGFGLSYPALILGGSVNWVNSGTVSDGGLIAVGDASGLTATLTNKAGATFDLTSDDAGISLDTGASATFSNAGTLEKTGGTATSYIDATVANTGTITVTSGILDFAGSTALAGTVSGAGEIDVSGAATITAALIDTATLKFLSSLDNESTITVQGGTLDLIATPTGTGSINISQSGTVYLGAGFAAGNTVKFLDATGTLALGNAAAFAGTISHFVAGDTIDLVGLARSSITGDSFANGVLTITTSGGTDLLHITGAFTTNSFILGIDHAGTGTSILLL